MQRRLEPELMDDPQQARAYALADFSTSNQAFVDLLLAEAAPHLQQVVDLGCGPGDVVIRLARAWPGLQISAVDGSAAMIELARVALRAAGLEAQINLIEGYIPGVPAGEQRYDAVLSKDFLHHLPDPLILWQEVRRLGKPGGLVFVMDLIRPDSPAAALAIVERVAPDADPLLKQDFYNSLCAACTLAEVETQLRVAGLELALQQVSERHMLIKGRL